MKTALITGASSGIGRALAARLARRGTTVAVAARRADKLDDLCQSIASAGGKARPVVLDVADPDAVVSMVERLDDELGGLDLVVANAGVGGTIPGAELTWAKAAPVLMTNAVGAIATLSAALPRMIARRRGHLVGISSLAAYRGLPGSAAYSASKAALSTFLEGLRVDLAGTGVTVSDVRPGFIDTEMSRALPTRPMLMTLDACVERIVRAIDEREPVAAFPLPLAAALAGSTLLPRSAFDAIVRRGAR